MRSEELRHRRRSNRDRALRRLALLTVGLSAAWLATVAPAFAQPVPTRAWAGTAWIRERAVRGRSRRGELAALLAAARSEHGRDRGRPGRADARAAIVGGTEIPIGQAPWQVAVFQEVPAEGGAEAEIELCGGAILDETTILTAGHCAVNPNTAVAAAPADMLVVAGVSDLEVKEASEQTAKVGRVRVHPYYDYASGPGAADDVAVLTLAKPLSLGGATAQAIAPAAAGVETPEGTPVRITGFGEEEPVTEELTGRLNALAMNVVYSRECGGEADALFICASAAGGSACRGDSGGGVTGASLSLLGVEDIVELRSGQRCADGALAGFVNLEAGEIRDFVEGSEEPPRAPRGGKAVIRGVPSVGRQLTCEPGSWSSAPTFSYAFVNSAGGEVLQSGASQTYWLTAADAGRRILCEVRATTAGGTGEGRTPPMEAIQVSPSLYPPAPAPGSPRGSQPPPTGGAHTTAESSVGLHGSTLIVSGGAAIAHLDCVTQEGCHGKLSLAVTETVKGRHGARHGRTVMIASGSFSVGDGVSAVRLVLNVAGRALLRRSHGRLGARLTIAQLEPTHTVYLTENVKLERRTPGRHRARRRH